MSPEERQAFWSSVTRGEEIQIVIVGSGEDAKDIEVPPKMAECIALGVAEYISSLKVSMT